MQSYNVKYSIFISSIRNNPHYNYYYESHARSTNTNENTKSYYSSGGAGMKKFPNYVIIAMCTGVALIGILLQVFVIRSVLTANYNIIGDVDELYII